MRINPSEAVEEKVVVLKYQLHSGRAYYVAAPQFVGGVEVRLRGDTTLAKTLGDPIIHAHVLNMTRDEYEDLCEAELAPGPFPELISREYGSSAD